MQSIKTISYQAFCILLLVLSCNISFAKIIYVDDNAAGTNDGTSWENAYVYLQDALANAKTAEKPVEIRVAQGIYKPDQGIRQTPGDKDATFRLVNNIILIGGYAGFGGSDPNACDVDLYETVLSGDLAGNDIEFDNIEDPKHELTHADNSCHVVTILNNITEATLDGFTITGGDTFSGGYGPFGLGSGLTTEGGFSGGLENIDSSIAVRNCTFSMNSAAMGSGVYIKGGSWTMVGCTFSRNYGINCSGMLIVAESLRLANCTFIANSGSQSSTTAGIDCNNVVLTNCIFSGNINLQGECGGNMLSIHGNAIITNCTFIDYFSNGPGAGIHINDSAVLTNCILRNGGNEIVAEDESMLQITHSNIEGGWPGVGNIDEDPLFAKLGYWADANDLSIVVEPNYPYAVWVDGDYHLKSEYGRWNPDTQTWATDDVTSPCIDAGDPNTPVGDEPFPNGVIINMGAYGGTAEASKSISDIPEVVNVNDSDNGSEVTLRQGQILAVTLESNPSTGYSWAPVEKQNSILEKFGDTLYFPAEQDDEIVGAGGWEILYFRAVSIGQETLELIYRRPSETDVEPIKTFSIEVTVN